MLLFYLSICIDDASKSKLEAIYLQHRHTMFWTANKILKDSSLAEDVVHDAFLRIINHLEKIIPENSNKTRGFVVIVVKNIALDRLRKSIRHPESDLDEFEHYLEDENSNPEKAMMVEEGRQTVLKTLSRLKPIYVDVLSLHILYGFEDTEIARLLNISKETARVRLHRGRKKLALLLKADAASE